MARTPVLTQPVVEQLAHCMYTVFHTAIAPFMNLRAIYGIVIPNNAPFGPDEANALVPQPHVVSDAFADTGAEPFARLPLDEDLDVVSVAISGETHQVLSVLTLPDSAVGLVVASQAMLAALGPAIGAAPEFVPGYLAAAAGPGHTYALAGVPDRNVCGHLRSNHPDVAAVTAVVNKNCCRTS
ncbi:MAG: hypothetical protein RI958_1949 [Actinomycetota bacterium]|jgi:hypothetical protein